MIQRKAHFQIALILTHNQIAHLVLISAKFLELLMKLLAMQVINLMQLRAIGTKKIK